MTSNRLIDFIYTLARDHVPMGTLEDIMWSYVDTSSSSYCNNFLEDYARDLARRLTNDLDPITDWKHMYRSADGKERYYRDADGTKTEDAPYKRIAAEDKS